MCSRVVLKISIYVYIIYPSVGLRYQTQVHIPLFTRSTCVYIYIIDHFSNSFKQTDSHAHHSENTHVPHRFRALLYWCQNCDSTSLRDTLVTVVNSRSPTLNFRLWWRHWRRQVSRAIVITSVVTRTTTTVTTRRTPVTPIVTDDARLSSAVIFVRRARLVSLRSTVMSRTSSRNSACDMLCVSDVKLTLLTYGVAGDVFISFVGVVVVIGIDLVYVTFDKGVVVVFMLDIEVFVFR